jgi:two-component system, chemotaxis family, protein-glutamate methylesterase/glutaminase
MQAAHWVNTHDIVVIGASAGGVEALTRVVSGLPRDLRAAVLIVLHLSRGRSVLPEILTRASRLPASHPRDGDELQYGRIYVAPPDFHLTVAGTKLRVQHGPSENGVRPAVDPLFRSAARSYGPRVIGIVLTGSLDDGTAGLAAVKEAGGVTVVQDPDEAFAPSMPRSAMSFVDVDHVLPLREIPILITTLAKETASGRPRTTGPHLDPIEPDGTEAAIARSSQDRPGQPAIYSCPECSGTLWETDENGILRFRCRVGHAYTADSMLSAQTDSVDRALWAALRSLEERAALTNKMAERARDRQHPWVANAFAQRALEAEKHAAVVREMLVHRTTGHDTPEQTMGQGVVPPTKPELETST